MYKLVDKDGKTLNTDGVDPKIVALLTAAVDGIGHQVSAAMSSSITNATKDFGEKITDITEQLKARGKQGDDGEGKGGEGDAGDGGKQGDASELMKLLTALTEKVDGIEDKFGEQQSAASARDLGTKYLKANHPHLKPEQAELVLAQIVSGKATDEAAVKTIVEGVQNQMKILGGDVAIKSFSADPVDEGGESGGSAKDNFDKDAALEQLDKEAAQRAGG